MKRAVAGEGVRYTVWRVDWDVVYRKAAYVVLGSIGGAGWGALLLHWAGLV